MELGGVSLTSPALDVAWESGLPKADALKSSWTHCGLEINFHEKCRNYLQFVFVARGELQKKAVDTTS